MAHKALYKGTLILVISGFVLKVLGFIYRIYVSNLVGAEGMGLFQLVFPIYTLIVLTLTSGVSIAVSRVTADLNAKHKTGVAGSVMKVTAFGTVIVGCFISVILWLFSDEIAFNVLRDGRTYISIIAILPCIPFIICSSAIKGYFYGLQKMYVPAIAQIIEQILRVGIVLLYADMIPSLGLEYGTLVIILSTVVGELGGLVILIIGYYLSCENVFHKDLNAKDKYRGVQEVVRISVPISLNKFVTSILGTVEFILIPVMLQKYGMSYSESIEELGKFSGMALPMIMFPAIATSALATTLVPAISEAYSVKNYSLVNRRISRALQISVTMGCIFSAIFMLRSELIGELLFKNQGVGDMIYKLSFVCILIYVQQTINGIVNGIGRQTVGLLVGVLGSVVRLLFVFFGIPQFGVDGYLMGSGISLVLICGFSIHLIMKSTGAIFRTKDWIVKPLVLMLSILCVTTYLDKLMDTYIGREFSDWVSVSLGVLICCLIFIGFGNMRSLRLGEDYKN